MLNISINSAELSSFFSKVHKYEKDVKEGVLKEVTRASYAISTKAKTETPVKTGNLRRQIYVKIYAGKVAGIVGVNTNYAMPVHEGSKPHIIKVKNKKVLAAYLGRNKFRFLGKQVNHPGTKANRFLTRAVDKEQPIYLANMARILNTVK